VNVTRYEREWEAKLSFQNVKPEVEVGKDYISSPKRYLCEYCSIKVPEQ